MKNILRLSGKHSIYSIIMAAIMSIALLAGLAHVPRALAEEGSVTATANTLRVSPVRTDITITPGEKTVIKTVVTNLTNKAVSVRPSMNDFVAGGEDGSPALILEEDQYAPSHSLKRFMTPLDDFKIAANGTAAVEVELNVPNDAKAGGYYGAVRFSPTNPDGGGQVNLSASVASIILATIPGEVTEKLSLTDFEIRQNEKPNGIFLSPDALEASFRFHSDSGVHLSPFGKISVKNRGKVVYEVDFNDETPREMVLPDSHRRWNVPLKEIGTFGKYEVHAIFTYGSGNQTIEVYKSFWVVPLAVIIGAVIGLLVAIGLVVWLVSRLRGRNQQGGRPRRR